MCWLQAADWVKSGFLCWRGVHHGDSELSIHWRNSTAAAPGHRQSIQCSDVYHHQVQEHRNQTGRPLEVLETFQDTVGSLCGQAVSDGGEVQRFVHDSEIVTQEYRNDGSSLGQQMPRDVFGSRCCNCFEQRVN